MTCLNVPREEVEGPGLEVRPVWSQVSALSGNTGGKKPGELSGPPCASVLISGSSFMTVAPLWARRPWLRSITNPKYKLNLRHLHVYSNTFVSACFTAAALSGVGTQKWTRQRRALSPAANGLAGSPKPGETATHLASSLNIWHLPSARELRGHSEVIVFSRRSREGQ